MKTTSLVALTVLAAFASTAQASTLTVLGRAGYEFLKSDEAKSDAEASKGFSVGGTAQLHFFDFVVGSLYGAGGLQYTRTVKKFEMDTGIANTAFDGKIETTTSGVSLPVEAGVSISAIPLLTVQGAVGWDFGLWGEAKSDLPQIKTVAGTVARPSRSQVNDLKSYGALTATGRLLFTPFPFLRTGAEFSYQKGSLSTDQGGSRDDFKGYGIRLVAGVDF